MGLAFFQDMIALLAFTILWGFQNTMIPLPDIAALANTTALNTSLPDAAALGNATVARRAGGEEAGVANAWVRPDLVWHDRFVLNSVYMS